MKKWFPLSTLLIFFVLALFISGCATSSVEQEKDRHRRSIEERILSAEAKKGRLLNQLDHSESIDEKVEIKAALADLQEEIDMLKSSKGRTSSSEDMGLKDEEDGFKSTKDRKIIYGPLGAVLHFTEWILEKMYIMN
jgi:hypothetical protein